MSDNVILYVSLGLLLGSFLLQLAKPRILSGGGPVRERSVRWAFRGFFYLGVLFVVGWYAYLVVGQYLAWKAAGPPLSYLVPPYRSILYVAWYHYIRFGMYYSFSIAAGIFFLIAASAYNRAFTGRFFEFEEPYLGALAIVLLGNPAWNYLWLYYLVALFAAAFLGLVAADVVKKENFRLPLYHLWMPLAIVGIIMATVIKI